MRPTRAGRQEPLSVAAALVGACVIGFGPHAVAQSSAKLPSNAHLATAPGGVVAAWDLGGKKLTVRRRADVLTTCSTAALSEPEAFALASTQRALALSYSGGSLVAFLIDTSSCRELKRVAVGPGSPPFEVSGLEKEGWLIQLSRERVVRMALDMSERSDLALPSSPSVGRPTSANPGASEQQALLTRNGVWVFPRAAYLPFRLSGNAPQALDVPACLSALGYELAGEEYVRWIESAMIKADANGRAVLERWLAAARQGSTLFMGATPATAVDDTRVGVLVRVDRGRLCRLDTWDVAKGELRSTQIIPGACSSALSLDGPDAWTASRGEWQRVILSTAPPSCP